MPFGKCFSGTLKNFAPSFYTHAKKHAQKPAEKGLNQKIFRDLDFFFRGRPLSSFQFRVLVCTIPIFLKCILV